MRHLFLALALSSLALFPNPRALAGEAAGTGGPPADAGLAAPKREQVRLEDVVVTSNRGESSWKDAPVMVTVIDRQELQDSPVRTVDEFLARLPGVSFKRTLVAECGPGREITLQGVPEQKRTLILLDGVPINDGFNGAVNWSLVPKDAVERIEIVRGPMSALYGSGAMGGVINLITRMPVKPNETLVRGSYGNLNTSSGDLLQGGMFEKQGYLLAGRIYNTDGYMKVEDPQPCHVDNRRTDWSVLGKVDFLPAEDALLAFSIYAVDEDYSRGRLFDNQDNTMIGGRLTYEQAFARGVSLQATLYGNYNYREVGVSAPPTYLKLDHTETDDIYRIGELASIRFPAGRFNTVTAGIDFTFNFFDKSNAYASGTRFGKADGKQYLFSFFGQDELEFGKGDHRFLFTLGVRGDTCGSFDGTMIDTNPAPNPPIDEDYEDKTWFSASPKAGFVYRHAESTTLRASVGRSFAAPTLSELYMVFTRGPIVVDGNPELDPETALSFSVGADQWFLKDLLGRVDAYYTIGYDFIGTRKTGPTSYRYDNISRVEIVGADAELRYRILPSLSAYAGYTFNLSTVLRDDADPENEGNELPFEPRHKARLGVTFDDPRYFIADLSATYVGRRYAAIENTDDDLLDDFVSLDLYIARNIGEHVLLAVAFQNLLDERYEVYSIPTEVSYAPGFLVSGYVTVQF